jgi:hypothetical protein
MDVHVSIDDRQIGRIPGNQFKHQNESVLLVHVRERG